MNNVHRQLLRSKRVYLLENMTRLEEVLDYLETNLIMSEDQRQRILSHAVLKDRLRAFLDTIVRCGPNAFEQFQTALRETHQDSILEVFQSVISQAGPVGANLPESTTTDHSSTRVDQNVLHEKPVDLRTVQFEPYRVNSFPRGYVLVINVEHYDENARLPNRDGSPEDVAKLCALFREYSYSVAVLPDPSGRELEQAVQRFAQKPEHSDVHAGILFVLAHGIEHHVVAKDGSLVNINNLISCFTNPKCPRLAGKPKLLVIQACRGEQRDQGFFLRKERIDPVGLTSVDHSLDPSSWLSLPYMTDCVIVYTTLPGFVSWRSKTEGSWYISTFVDVVRRHGQQSHIMDLLAEVNNRLVDESANLKIYQISQPVHTLRKPFYLSTEK